MSFEIRYMTAWDLRKVARIEAEVFPDPMSDVRIARINRNGEAIYLVADHPDVTKGVVGFLSYVAHPRHLELTRVGVLPRYQRQGVGSLLVRALYEMLPVLDKNRLAMSISERNTPAHHWLRSNGFAAIRVERGKDEDLYRFVRRLPVEAGLAIA